jgi:hypothetical protein
MSIVLPEYHVHRVARGYPCWASLFGFHLAGLFGFHLAGLFGFHLAGLFDFHLLSPQQKLADEVSRLSSAQQDIAIHQDQLKQVVIRRLCIACPNHYQSLPVYHCH